MPAPRRSAFILAEVRKRNRLNAVVADIGRRSLKTQIEAPAQ
jgi:hypothetical protein